MDPYEYEYPQINEETMYDIEFGPGEAPMISYDSLIDRFILDAPNGETYYFRDWEGAEDFWALNFKDDVELE